jgi:3-deoxy-manno-octulosonate cytidylyltransferase (CMP-KDO synthetase)
MSTDIPHKPQNPDHPVALVVIPARVASQRLPGKLLLRETGKSVLQHTYEAACQARLPVEVVIAAADQAIADEAHSFAARCIRTDPNAPSGTDRVAAVARQHPEHKILVNVQGDEPEIAPQAIDLVIQELTTNPDAQMATLAAPIRDQGALRDPARVKVVLDRRGRALYFSRSPIPHPRDGAADFADPPAYLQHLGLYAYRREFLLQLASQPPATLERIEQLEQLRALDAGATIQVAQIDHSAAGIDTPADYREFVMRMQRRCA